MSALFVKHLTVLDFSYVHPARGILGESWIVDMELHGDLDQQGMVFDFGLVKRQVRDAVESLFDHKLVVPGALQGLQVDSANGVLDLRWQDAAGRQFRHLSPVEGVELVSAPDITPDSLVQQLQQVALAAVPSNVKKVVIELRTEDIAGAFYQYSHGLKKHGGNCQRIAHGHRSRIKILRNGKRDSLLEKAWSLKWKDIYIGTRADLISEFEREGVRYIHFGYLAEQGRFELTLPAAQVYLIDTDSTVEYLADHIAACLKAEDPEHSFEVRAFEGVMKGALAWR
jgi:6-pyruvoyl-tetrahydropterin synthase